MADMYIPPPATLRNLTTDEVLRMFDGCGHPVIETLCRHLGDAETDLAAQVCELESGLSEMTDTADVCAVDLAAEEAENEKLREEVTDLHERIEQLEQQIRNLGGVPA